MGAGRVRGKDETPLGVILGHHGDDPSSPGLLVLVAITFCIRIRLGLGDPVGGGWLRTGRLAVGSPIRWELRFRTRHRLIDVARGEPRLWIASYWSARMLVQQLVAHPILAAVAVVLVLAGSFGEGIFPLPAAGFDLLTLIGVLGLVYVGSGFTERLLGAMVSIPGAFRPAIQ